jgi:hypothetical protein
LPPPRRGGLFGWLSRRPRTAFFSTLAIGLLIGVAIGASGGVEQQTLDQANVRADRAEGQVSSLGSDLRGAQDRRMSRSSWNFVTAVQRGE